jgi:membrane-associated protease RseP (regulator of RpoE activity)
MTDLHTRPERPPVPEPNAPVEGEHPGSPLGLAVLIGLVLFAGVGGGWPLLVMIGAIVVMIFLHELGHYLTAKWAGMKVTEFFIGFGPRIWSFRRGETEYGVKAIPAGAYVKIIGMHNLDEYDPADADRTYMSKPYWRRLSVAVAGSTMHFVLALVSLFTLFAVVGVPGGRLPTNEAEAEAIEETAAWEVLEVTEDSAAEAAGIEPGDTIVAVDGRAIEGFPAFTRYVADRPGEDVELTVRRGADEFTVDATLGDEHPTTGENVGFFGVARRYIIPDETLGLVDSVGETFSAFGSTVSGTFEGLGRILSPSGLFDLGDRVVSGDEDAGPTVGGSGDDRDGGGSRTSSDRPVSIVGVTRIGPDLLSSDGLYGFLSLFVLLNVFIGIFNLVPLLPLDGGHVAIATYEKIRSMLRRGEPYHVDVAKLLPITYAVVLVLVFIGISTIWLDISDPIGG